MNEDFLGSAVSDWLKSTDSPPADRVRSRATAAARAREIRQAGRWWPLPGLPRRPVAESAATVLTVLAFVLIGGAFTFALLPRSADAPVLVAGASPPAEPAPPPVHWQTDVVDFQADGLALDVNDLLFTAGDAPAAVHSDPGDLEYWTLEIVWLEHDVEQRMNLYFAANDTHWWVTEARTYDGYPQGEWAYAYGPFFKTPLGEAFEGNVVMELVGGGRPRDAGNRVAATLAIEDLRLSVSPGTRGERRGDPPSTIGEIVSRGLRIWDDLFSPPDPPTRADPTPSGRTVRIPYEGSLLTGELLEDGVVRIVDDGAGNKLTPVVSIAIDDDSTIWVARRKVIFALGRPGEVRAGTQGPRRDIERIEANGDGSLTVYADGVWRLDEDVWTQLEQPQPSTLVLYGEQGSMIWKLPDGLTLRLPPSHDDWGDDRPASEPALSVREGDVWVPFQLEEVFPGARARFPDERLTPRVLIPTPNGDVWTYSPRSLSRLHDGSWEEVGPAFVESLAGGGPIVIRDVLANEEGTLWVLVQVEKEVDADSDAVQRLLRMSDGVWSSESLVGALPDGVNSRFYGLDHAEGDGVRLLERDRNLDYAYGSTGLVRTRARWPHDAVTTADGSIWGTGRPRNEGLLMIPAAEPVLFEAATHTAGPEPTD